MHAHDQYLLVVRAVEDPDLAAFRQHPGTTPEKIVLQLLRAWMFETEDLAALRVDARHHMLDGAVFSGGVHRLEDQQDRVAVARVQQLL